MKKVLNWLVNSSVNPDEVSMTVKGILLTDGGYVINHLNDLGFHITNTTYTTDVGIACTVFGMMLAVIGMVRKIAVSASKK